MSLHRIVNVTVVLCGIALQASALDYSEVKPVQPISDGRVSIGKRTVVLPDGRWTYISYVKGEVSTQATGMRTPTHTGYFANVQDRSFTQSVVFEFPENTMPTASWRLDPCRNDGNVLKSTVDSTARFPECLLVNRRDGLHLSPAGSFYPPAKQWLDENVSQPVGAIYDIAYSLYTAHGHGLVRVFVPVGAFQNSEDVALWAKQLPVAFRPFIEGRASEARLPSLPKQ